MTAVPKPLIVPWIVDAIESIVYGIARIVGHLWRTIARYGLVLGTLGAGLIVGWAVSLFAGDWTSLWGWGFAATFVVFCINIGIVFYSVFRQRKHANMYREYMEMLSNVNEERDKRYKMFFIAESGSGIMSEELCTLDDSKNSMQEYFYRKPVATLTKHEKKHELDHWERQFTARFRAEIDKRPGLKGDVVGWGGPAIGSVGVTTAFSLNWIIGLCITISGCCLSAYERYDSGQETGRQESLFEPVRLVYSRRDELIRSMRRINAWIEDGAPPLQTGRTYRLGINIGRLRERALASAELREPEDWTYKRNLLIVVSGHGFTVQPRQHNIALPRIGETEPVFFAVTPTRQCPARHSLYGGWIEASVQSIAQSFSSLPLLFGQRPQLLLRISFYLACELALLQEFEIPIEVQDAARAA